MAYFDITKETLVTVDASPVGISATLGQRVKGTDDYRVVAYASRALTAVERRCSQLDRTGSFSYCLGCGALSPVFIWC